MTVLGAAAGLDADDAFNLDLGAATEQPHLMCQSQQIRDRGIGKQQALQRLRFVQPDACVKHLLAQRGQVGHGAEPYAGPARTLSRSTSLHRSPTQTKWTCRVSSAASSARSMCTSSRSLAKRSTSPLPHSTTVTELGRSASRSRSSTSATLPSRYASTCTIGNAPSCTRAITNVGDTTVPPTPRPSPIPCASVVLPAPSVPTSNTKSPARNTRANRTPSACMSRAAPIPTDFVTVV